MGQEIEASRFSRSDFETFAARLREETALLSRWFTEGRFSSGSATAGFEMEVWLVGSDQGPAPVLEPFLQRLDDELVVPELATFNAEINCLPMPLEGTALSQLAAALRRTWTRCLQVSKMVDARLAMIGILPTVRPEHLIMANMTPRQRYRALNDQIFSLRHGQPLGLRISGRDRLDMQWHDVMLEAAATSFQIHLKVAPEQAARLYNASKILSAPLVAVAANSPYLFGRELWHETRIPLFEQAVSVGGPVLNERVNFGFRYAKDSIVETFEANLARYPILLPQLTDTPPEALAHLRLHNGTIWRWNRPLIGFEEDGTPHLRIEHRVMPAGPTIPDAIANAALYYGAANSLINETEPPEKHLPFEVARENFYAAARLGLEAQIPWLDGKTLPISRILTEDLLPRARSGLAAFGIPSEEAARWLDIIAARIATGQNGTVWQLRWTETHGSDARRLTNAYLERQDSDEPVHSWTLG